jgi:hypothetical protein
VLVRAFATARRSFRKPLEGASQLRPGGGTCLIRLSIPIMPRANLKLNLELSWEPSQTTKLPIYRSIGRWLLHESVPVCDIRRISSYFLHCMHGTHTYSQWTQPVGIKHPQHVWLPN